MDLSFDQNKYTPEEYLELDRQGEYKSEYIDGLLLAMVGASRHHNQITVNIASEMRSQMKGRPCVVYANDMRVKIAGTGMYAYPDIVATCGEPVFEDSHVDTLLNPAVIIEVLSDSTEAYDRGTKFAHYRRLGSLREYVLVAQDGICMEHYVRDGERWIFSEIGGLEGSIRLETVGCTLLLSEVYDKVGIAEDKRACLSPPGKAEG